MKTNAPGHHRETVGARPPRFLRMLETEAIDVVMPVTNYADLNIYNFDGTVLPECRKRNVGVAAMKVYAGIVGGFPNHRRASVGCNTPKRRRATAFQNQSPDCSHPKSQIANLKPRIPSGGRIVPVDDERKAITLRHG